MRVSTPTSAVTSGAVTSNLTVSAAPTLTELKERLRPPSSLPGLGDSANHGDEACRNGGRRRERKARRRAPDQNSRQTPSAGAWPRLIVVVGTQPGVGATSVSLFLADVLHREGVPTVVHHAAEGRSQTIEAATTPCDAAFGARTRGDVLVTAVAGTIVDEVEDGRGDGPDLAAGHSLVVDAGLYQPSSLRWQPWPEVGSLGRIVVATEASIPGLRRCEAVLETLPRVDAIVAVGARRWPPAALAAAGPAFRRAHAAGACSLIPRSRRLFEEGLDDRPAPRPVDRAVMALLQRLAHDADPDDGGVGVGVGVGGSRGEGSA